MPNWGQVLASINESANPLDMTRRKYLKIMNKYTDRNVIAYYSALSSKIAYFK